LHESVGRCRTQFCTAARTPYPDRPDGTPRIRSRRGRYGWILRPPVDSLHQRNQRRERLKATHFAMGNPLPYHCTEQNVL
jgi:hypothetical protein